MSVLYSVLMGLFNIGNLVWYFLKKQKYILEYNKLNDKMLIKKIKENKRCGLNITSIIGTIGAVSAIYEVYININKGIVFLNINPILYLLGLFFNCWSLKARLMERVLYGRMK